MSANCFFDRHSLLSLSIFSWICMIPFFKAKKLKTDSEIKRSSFIYVSRKIYRKNTFQEFSYALVPIQKSTSKQKNWSHTKKLSNWMPALSPLHVYMSVCLYVKMLE